MFINLLELNAILIFLFLADYYSNKTKLLSSKWQPLKAQDELPEGRFNIPLVPLHFPKQKSKSPP